MGRDCEHYAWFDVSYCRPGAERGNLQKSCIALSVGLVLAGWFEPDSDGSGRAAGPCCVNESMMVGKPLKLREQTVYLNPLDAGELYARIKEATHVQKHYAPICYLQQ